MVGASVRGSPHFRGPDLREFTVLDHQSIKCNFQLCPTNDPTIGNSHPTIVKAGMCAAFHVMLSGHSDSVLEVPVFLQFKSCEKLERFSNVLTHGIKAEYRWWPIAELGYRFIFVTSVVLSPGVVCRELSIHRLSYIASTYSVVYVGQG